jgi:lipid II:glycine glycyltransferase (peptidoglycan interpeptide bridge formation enzyme)
MSIDTNRVLDVRPISEAEYEEFLKGRDYSALQAPGQFNRMKVRGDDARIYGGFENGKLVIAMLCRVSPAMKVFKWCYSPRGYVCDDIQDTDLVKAFMEGLKKILKKERVIFIEIESPVEIRQRDENGAVVEEGYSHEDYRQAMKQAGFDLEELKQDGYDVNRQCRWVSILDVIKYEKPYDGLPMTNEALKNPQENFTYYTEDELLKNMNIKTRQHIKMSQKDYIKIRPLGYEELDVLQDMEGEAASRHHYEMMGISAYQLSMKGYGENCQVLYAYVDLDTYQQTVSKDMEQTEKDLQAALEDLQTNPDSKKKNRRATNLQQQKESLLKKQQDVDSLKAQYDKEVPLAAALFLTTPTETLYLFSGSKRDLSRFKGAYAIQWHMIRETLKRKALRYNFWGISGNFNPEEDGYGVFEFKKGFGARVGEYAGKFVYPVMPAVSAFYENRLKKKGAAGAI